MTATTEIEAGVAVDPGLVTKWFSVRAMVPDDAVQGRDETDNTDRADGPLTLVASTEKEDRAGDVVLASGWDLAAYRANPVFLWAHDYRRPAIGKCVKAWVQDSGEGGRLMASIQFAPTPFAQEIRSLYAAGFMRGVSVGFRAIEMEPRAVESGGRGVLFKRQELLEISAAPVPVNPEALVRQGMAAPNAKTASSLGAGLEAVDAGELLGARREIRNFWQVLAAASGDDDKYVDVEAEGAIQQ